MVDLMDADKREWMAHPAPDSGEPPDSAATDAAVGLGAGVLLAIVFLASVVPPTPPAVIALAILVGALAIAWVVVGPGWWRDR
jgi:hypothetical protein